MNRFCFSDNSLAIFPKKKPDLDTCAGGITPCCVHIQIGRLSSPGSVSGGTHEIDRLNITLHRCSCKVFFRYIPNFHGSGFFCLLHPTGSTTNSSPTVRLLTPPQLNATFTITTPVDPSFTALINLSLAICSDVSMVTVLFFNRRSIVIVAPHFLVLLPELLT